VLVLSSAVPGFFAAGADIKHVAGVAAQDFADYRGAARIGLGLIPGAGATQRLTRLVGRGRALELMLTGREIHGDEAWRIGLVDRVLYRDPVAETLDVAAQMARASAPAMSEIINCVDVGGDLPHERGMAVEGMALLSVFENGEAREGIAAFLEKRAPRFA
jgi:enoyl-CoA hydratase